MIPTIHERSKSTDMTSGFLRIVFLLFSTKGFGGILDN